MWEKVSTVTAREVAAYLPRYVDLAIAEALTLGATTPQEIQQLAGVQVSHVREALLDPIAAAWISAQVAAQIQHRTGLVDAALFSRALTGDTAAMRLFFERFKQHTSRTEVVHSKGMDYARLSDEDLDRILAERSLTIEAKVIPTQEAPQILDQPPDAQP